MQCWLVLYVNPTRKTNFLIWYDQFINSVKCQLNIAAEELQALKEEFSHHQDKIDQYFSLLNKADLKEDKYLNSIDENLDRFNMVDKEIEEDNNENNYILNANKLR